MYDLFHAAEDSKENMIRQPFAAFQQVASDNDDEDEDDVTLDDGVPTVVYNQIKYGEDIAVGLMRMSDGSQVHAEKYTPSGVFLVAHFPGGETLETDIHKKYLEPRGTFIQRPPTRTPPKKAKAKAKRARSASRRSPWETRRARRRTRRARRTKLLKLLSALERPGGQAGRLITAPR